MRMELTPTQRMEMTVVLAQELGLLGGMTDSIFPEVEAWLQVDADHMNALGYVAARKNAAKYKSQMDFLVCEVFEHVKPACFAYYRGKGSQLRMTLTVERREYFARVMLCFLQLAYDAFQADRRVTWGWTRDEALSLISG